MEGLAHHGRRPPPLLVIPPPPGEGGMDHVVGLELAWAASRAGHPTLRFNFRGVGASQGMPGDEAARCRDIEAALRVLAENAGTVAVAVAALGSSAVAALRVADAHPGLAGVALVSPGRFSPERLGRARHPLLVVVGSEEPGPRAALAAQLAELSATLVEVAGADAGFRQGLPEVGRAVAEWLDRLASP